MSIAVEFVLVIKIIKRTL